MTGFLLRLVDGAVETAEREGEKTISTPSGDVVVPPEYFMALNILMRMPDSPYYSRTDPDFKNDDWALAECLVQGKDAAKSVFVEDARTHDVPRARPNTSEHNLAYRARTATRCAESSRLKAFHAPQTMVSSTFFVESGLL